MLRSRTEFPIREVLLTICTNRRPTGFPPVTGKQPTLPVNTVQLGWIPQVKRVSASKTRAFCWMMFEWCWTECLFAIKHSHNKVAFNSDELLNPFNHGLTSWLFWKIKCGQGAENANPRTTSPTRKPQCPAAAKLAKVKVWLFPFLFWQCGGAEPGYQRRLDTARELWPLRFYAWIPWQKYIWSQKKKIAVTFS